MLRNVICYRVKESVIYNKGKPYETSCDTFLYCYVHRDEVYTQQLVNDLNNLLKTGVIEYHGLKLDTIKEFYADKQEEMW